MKATFLLPIPDHRLAQGKLYDLPHLLLFSILAVMSGETSYRWVHQFIRTHRARLNETFGCCWRQTPAHRLIRYALQGLDVSKIAPDFRAYVWPLAEHAVVIALIGKTLCGSLDCFKDRRTAQVVSAFAVGESIVLGQILSEAAR